MTPLREVLGVLCDTPGMRDQKQGSRNGVTGRGDHTPESQASQSHMLLRRPEEDTALPYHASLSLSILFLCRIQEFKISSLPARQTTCKPQRFSCPPCPLPPPPSAGITGIHTAMPHFSQRYQRVKLGCLHSKHSYPLPESLSQPRNPLLKTDSFHGVRLAPGT